jgi:hypothetical protein
VNFGQEVAEISTKINARAGHGRKTRGPRRLKLLFRAIVAVAAIVPSLLALQAVAGQAASAATTATAPTVTSLAPASGPAAGGTFVTITGSGFTGVTAVMFGSTPADSFNLITPTTILASSPEGTAGTVDITVTSPGGTSSTSAADQYTYFNPASVTGVTPNSGPTAGGTTVTVTGSGFTGATSVLFGSTPATSFTVDSDTAITAVAPAGTAGIVDIRVLTPFNESPVYALDEYTYLGATPAITSVSPDYGPVTGGSLVIISGSDFNNVSAVLFGSTPAAAFTVETPTTISATAPAGSGTVDITLTNQVGTSGTSAADQYTYLALPTVTGVSPASGPTTGGNTVTITGSGFQAGAAFSPEFNLRFGSTPAARFTVDSDTAITATVPAGTVGPVHVTVATPAGVSRTSAADQYTYQPPAPTCTTTITGTNDKQLAVTSGLTCLVNATQQGQVTVAAGAALSVTNSTVTGTVTATSPSGITYCGATESGTLSVTGATGPVILGGTLPDGTACAADTIPSAVSITGATAPVTVTGLNQHGTLTLENDSAGVTLNGSQVNGLAYVENNAATAPAVITVSGNTVTGSLYCTGNNPAPTDNGTANTVSGTATGQCAGIAQP